MKFFFLSLDLKPPFVKKDNFEIISRIVFNMLVIIKMVDGVFNVGIPVRWMIFFFLFFDERKYWLDRRFRIVRRILIFFFYIVHIVISSLSLFFVYFRIRILFRNRKILKTLHHCHNFATNYIKKFVYRSLTSLKN